MKGLTILYEPLPMARIGVRLKDEEVVIATDFSTTAFMIEEYISLAVTKIAIPKSAPEIGLLPQMPSLLQKRIAEIDDSKEQDSVERLLGPLRAEFKVDIGDNRGLVFKNGTSRELRTAIGRVHRDVMRMALGFNHSIQIGINAEETAKYIRNLRKQVRSADARAVLSQLEGIFGLYEDIRFDAPKPNINAPRELVSIFDRLVNDSHYLVLSDAVNKLSQPEKRLNALVKLREYGRRFMSNEKITAGWNYAAKVIKVWTGVPIPETDALASIVSSRSFPMLVDLTSARNRAVEMWLAFGGAKAPYNRSGVPYTDDKVRWLPPVASMKASPPDAESLHAGTVGELLKALEDIQQTIVRGRNKE